ncbi:MAG: lamin tail domain-containing protein, partial [Planctomycetales bacterium]|nr:lamin tail domain-containing protein [Planctomycetales bacterium]
MLAVVVSEFMADNESTLADEDGAFSDWIELHNTDATPVSLDGWYLTDDDGQLDKWQIPDVTLSANDYLIVFASNKNRSDPAGELHTNFGLSNNGEFLAVVRPDGTTVEFAYAPEFPNQQNDVSYGLASDQITQGYFLSPTPGSPNIGEPVSNPDRAIVISEIMYHIPTTGILDPENTNEEYFEIYNRGSTPVDLTGWTVSAGVGFSFPTVSLAANDYLVIAADVATFSSFHPTVSNVVGGWTGILSNSGEALEITDDAGVRIDRVEYSDSGDWSVRTPGPNDLGHTGWIWSDDHDGGGHSLELINPAMSNQRGQNWAASLAVGGTPGASNSVASSNAAPFISNVTHDPAVPHANEPVTVTATLLDEQAQGLTATLYWRVDGSANFNTITMTDDGQGGDVRTGNGTYTAQIPAQSDRTVVEFFVRASDGSSSRDWPAPAELPDEPPASRFQNITNAMYQVMNDFDTQAAWAPGSPPVYFQIMTGAERSEFTGINRQSDAQMHATFISVTGTGVDIRYNTGVRIRGSGSRSALQPNNRINFPGDMPWHGVTAINLNVDTAHDQIAGAAIFQMAGLPTAEARPAIMYSNGENLRGGNTPYAHVETLNSEWAANHFPTDDGGNLYKGRRSNESPPGGQGAGLVYFGEDPAPYVSYTKLTNEAAADWSDVIELTDVLNNASNATYVSDVFAIADVQQWLRVLALTAIVDNNEGGLFIGDQQGDDYAMYRGNVDTRFKFVPHDLDTLFGSTTRGIFRFNGVSALNRLIQEPVFETMYYLEMHDLIDNVILTDRMNSTLDEVLRGVRSQGQIDSIKTFLIDRSAYILGIIPPLSALGGAGGDGEPQPEPGAPALPDLRINEILAMNQSTLDASGSTPDLIELYNAGSAAFDLTDMSMSDNSLSPRKYVFPAGSSLAPGEYLVLSADGNLPASEHNTGFSLDGAGEMLLLYDRPSRGGALMDSVEFGLQVVDASLGRAIDGRWLLSEPTLGTANVSLELGDPNRLLINEWQTDTKVTGRDDFIELYNPEVRPVALGGLFLSDEPNSLPQLHEIAPLSFIGGQGHQRFWADGNVDAGADHVPFRLHADQEMVALRSAEREIDRVLWVWQTTDVSQGLSPDGSTNYQFFDFPTPHLSNVIQGQVREDVFGYNEQWTYIDSGEDWGTSWREPGFDDASWPSDMAPFGVEGSIIPVPLETPLALSSPTQSSIATYYFRHEFEITDDPSVSTFEMTPMIDDGMIVYVNGQEVLRLGVADGPVDYLTRADRFITNATFEGPIEIPSDAFVLGTNVIAVELHQGTSGTGDIVFSTNLQTVSDRNARALFDDLRITEINYHPTANAPLEYVAVQNTGSQVLELNGVQLAGGIDFTFSTLMLDPGETVYVVENINAFQAEYGIAAAVAGQYSGRLDNDGDSLALNLPSPHEISGLRFSFNDWWVPASDGVGDALGIVSTSQPAASWDDRTSWQALTPNFDAAIRGDF